MSTTLDPNTTKENALSAVQNAGSEALRLIQSWLENANASALAEVSARGSGAPRKAARRALKVLKSRGVEVPRERRVATLRAPGDARKVKAWILAPDSSFNTLLVLAERSETSRFDCAMVFLNDDYGVTRVQHGEYSQSALKKALESMVPGERYKPAEVTADWARSRIHQALSKQRARGLVEPLGLTSIAKLLGKAPSSEVPHPFDAEGLEVALEDAREMSRDSGELHRLPEFAPWLPSRQAIDGMLQEVGKQLKPGEQPDQDKLSGLLQAAVLSATDRYFPPEQRERLVNAMKDSALSILARDGESLALRVSAAMQCIQNAGLITDPPSEIPFLKTFFDKAVAYLLAEGKGSLRIPIPNQPVPLEADATESADVGPMETAEPADENAGTPAPDANAEQAEAEPAKSE